MNHEGTNRTFYLPRLSREYYQGDAVVHWTLPVAERGIGWLNERFHFQFRELMLHASAREGLLCPTYCLMPDHIHLVWMGLKRDADQIHAMTFLRTYLEPKLAPHVFQHQAHDHALKEEERRRNAFVRVCQYIIQNPSRAGLIALTDEWPYTGAVLPGYPVANPRDTLSGHGFGKSMARSARLAQEILCERHGSQRFGSLDAQ